MSWTAQQDAMDTPLLNYYEALEKASADMLAAARRGDWDAVVRLESASSRLISQLQHAAQVTALAAEHRPAKSAIMCRILANDAEVRRLAEPWSEKLDALTGGRPRSSQ
jgi:flagellar protein FliT